MMHELKILPQYYEEVKARRKTFELRKNDRDYKVGDSIILIPWMGEYIHKDSMPPLTRKITYILSDCPEYGLMDGYVILGFSHQ